MSTFSDDFNRGNETPLASPWAALTLPGTFFSLNLVGSAVQATLTTGDWSAAVVDGLPFLDVQTCTATVSAFNAGTSGVFLLVRATASTGNCYLFIVSGGSALLFSIIAGVPALLGSAVGTVVAGDTITFSASGSSLVCSINGSSVVSAIDGSLTSGVPGLGVSTTGSLADTALDNFSATGQGTPQLILGGPGLGAPGIAWFAPVATLSGGHAVESPAVPVAIASPDAEGNFALCGSAFVSVPRWCALRC